jgi:hypothetical protein
MPTILKNLTVPTDEELRDDTMYLRDWKAYRSIFVECPNRKLSRKAQAEFLSVILAHVDHRSVYYSDGQPYELPEFDDVFPECEHYRAFSDYTKTDSSGLIYQYKVKETQRIRHFWILAQLYDEFQNNINLDSIDYYSTQHGAGSHA